MAPMTTQERLVEVLNRSGRYGAALAESPAMLGFGMVGCAEKLIKQLRDVNLRLADKVKRAKYLKRCLRGFRSFMEQIADSQVNFDLRSVLFQLTVFARSGSQKGLESLMKAVDAAKPLRQMRNKLVKITAFTDQLAELIRPGRRMAVAGFGGNVAQLRNELAQKEAQLRAKDLEIGLKDGEIAQRDGELAQRSTLIANLRAVIKRKNTSIVAFTDEIRRLKFDLTDAMNSNASLAANAFQIAMGGPVQPLVVNPVSAAAAPAPSAAPIPPTASPLLHAPANTPAPSSTAIQTSALPKLSISTIAPVVSAVNSPTVAPVTLPASVISLATNSTSVAASAPVLSQVAPVVSVTAPLPYTAPAPAPTSAPTTRTTTAPTVLAPSAPAAPCVPNPLVLDLPTQRRCRSCSPYHRVLGGGALNTPQNRVDATTGNGQSANQAKRSRSVDAIADAALDQVAVSNRQQPGAAVAPAVALAAHPTADLNGGQDSGTQAGGQVAGAERRRKDRKRRSSGADSMEDGEEPERKKSKDAVVDQGGQDGGNEQAEMDCGPVPTAPQPILSQLRVPADGTVDVEMDDLEADTTQASERDTGEKKDESGEKQDKDDVKLPRRRSRARDDDETSREQEEAIQKALDEEEDD